MRVIVTDDKTYRLGTFTIGMIMCISIMIHRIQNSSLYRFQTISCIRQSSFLNDVFGISAESLPHEIFQQCRDILCMIFYDILPAHLLPSSL